MTTADDISFAAPSVPLLPAVANGGFPDSEPADDPRPHSWHPINLTLAEALPPEPPNIGSIVYPARTHVWSGEPETLKSMVAMALALQQIREGRYVAYIDYENGIRETTFRLRSLGATDQELARFLYYQPEQPMLEDIRAEVVEQLKAYRPAFITIDSYTGSLATHGFDPNKAVDVENHHKFVVDPLRKHGAGVVLLDHLVKNRENRGRYSIGSERKIGVCDVHLSFDIILPLSRGSHGIVKLVTHKDRPGYLHRPKAAQVRFDSTPAGELTWLLEEVEDDPAAALEIFRPTKLMERVSIYVEHALDPPSRSRVIEGVRGNAVYIRTAIDVLLHEGHLTETAGARNAKLLHSITAYREENEPDPVRPRFPSNQAESDASESGQNEPNQTDYLFKHGNITQSTPSDPDSTPIKSGSSPPRLPVPPSTRGDGVRKDDATSNGVDPVRPNEDLSYWDSIIDLEETE